MPDRSTLARVDRRWLVGAAVAYVAAMLLVIAVAGPTLPIQQADQAQPTVTAVLVGQGNLVLALLLVGVALLVTRRRPRIDLAARAPERAVALRETVALLVYAAVVTVVGAVLGEVAGDYPISLHLPGTIYGLHGGAHLTPGWVALWVAYNVVFWAVVPYVVFRRRGYDAERLNLRSADRRGDLLLILVILVLESAAELALVSGAIFGLTPLQLAAGVPTAFAVNLLGTVLPIMIFIYAILLPRYARLTGSTTATVLLGGVSYAVIHLFDGWTDYRTLGAGIASFVFLFVQYFGPGLVKSVLTLRTGNAWVHVWAYHAIAPHVTLDTVTLMQDVPLHGH